MNRRQRESLRMHKSEATKVYPKKARLIGKFCKYGRTFSNPGISTACDGWRMSVIPIKGNQNDNWIV